MASRKRRFSGSGRMSGKAASLATTLNNDGVPVSASNRATLSPEDWTRRLTRNSVFWRPEYLADGGHIAHAPFLFWLVDVQRPLVVGDIGATRHSAAYFSVCQAVQQLGLATKCFAVENEDINSGESKISPQIDAYNRARYAEFSSLVGRTQGNTLLSNIDLLAVDLVQLEQAAGFRFDDWAPRMSERSVLVVHNTSLTSDSDQVRKDKLSELKRAYPHYEFAHGTGLTIFGVGAKQCAGLVELFDSFSLLVAKQAICDLFSRLGESCIDAYTAKQYDNVATQLSELERPFDEAGSNTAVADEATLDVSKSRLSNIASEITQWKNKLEAQSAEVENLKKVLNQIKAKFTEQSNQLASACNSLGLARATQERQLAEIKLLTEALLEARRQKTNSSVQSLANPNRKDANKRQRGQSGLSSLLDVFKGKQSAHSKKKREMLRLIGDSGLFDAEWYKATYPDVASSALSPVEHYLQIGAQAGHNPSPRFNTTFYMQKYKDVAAAGMNPLVHYLKHGRNEKRKIQPN